MIHTADISQGAVDEAIRSIHRAIRGELAHLRPPERLRLSEWSARHYYLSPESAAEPGRFQRIPYQTGIMDAITDPDTHQVTVQKSARVGYTKIVNATVGYYIDQDPCPIMVVQPTIEDAEGYSAEEIAPMIRDCPRLTAIATSSGKSKDAKNKILHKVFSNGASVSMVGANSGRGFRRVSRKVAILDEVDGYPASAGDEGDQIKLATRRTDYYWDRKIILGSTPLIAGSSRIEEQFLAGDQRRFHVPCPHCGHMDYLVFQGDRHERGHFMEWPEGKPELAHFTCRRCDKKIEEKDKHAMLEAGRWIGAKPFHGHASFHVWAAYSYSPNALWRHIAAEFEDAHSKGPGALKTFVNTWLGETWTEKGDAPEWRRLYDRREQYEIGIVPLGVAFLTAGVDVQKDRVVWEVAGWGRGKRSWSIDAGIILGDPSMEDEGGPWLDLQALLGRTFAHVSGATMRIAVLAIDSGAFTQHVYNWARKFPGNRVLATKGMDGNRPVIGVPTLVDVSISGTRIARGARMWPIGVDTIKTELYGWLKMDRPSKESGKIEPAGYCHFPEYPEEFFKQITAEQIVPRKNARGFVVRSWEKIQGRENHWLDARVNARAAAGAVGMDRFSEADWENAAALVGVELEHEPETEGGALELHAANEETDNMPAVAPADVSTVRREPWVARPGFMMRNR